MKSLLTFINLDYPHLNLMMRIGELILAIKIRQMKAKLFTLSLTLITVALSGQVNSAQDIKSGKIYYEEKIKLDVKLEGDAAQYSGMFPKERKSEKILSFSEDATLFESGKDISEDMTEGHSEGVNIKVVTSDDSKIFTDLKNKKITEQRDFMNRLFLVDRELPDAGWKITGNQKVILGYPCIEAVKEDTSIAKTTVWFAPSLTVQGGPEIYSNLPGMVLEVNVKDGSHTYLANSVVPVDESELKLRKPGEGKKVTEAEYNKIVADKMKEMGVEDDGKGGDKTHVRIIIRN